jgi:hypothetical protein
MVVQIPRLLEQLVGTQPNFIAVFAAQAPALNRHLLSVHHHEAMLAAPALRLAIRKSLVPAAGQCFDFFRHRQQHHLQSSLAHHLLKTSQRRY